MKNKIPLDNIFKCLEPFNLVLRVFRLLGQRAVAGRDLGLMEKYNVCFLLLAVYNNKTKDRSITVGFLR